MKSIFFVVAPPFLRPVARSPASAIDRNRDALRHSARNRMLNASMQALLVGVPGLEKSISAKPSRLAHYSSIRPANSRPQHIMKAGMPPGVAARMTSRI